jgi:excisionase family DNA binding protein
MLLKINEAATRLGVSPRTVERMLTAGELHRIKVRSATRIDERELEAFVAAQKNGGTPAPSGITEGQLRALHGKAGDLDRKRGKLRGESKRVALEQASDHFGRKLASANDLTVTEASWVLDLLESELAEEWRG